jgi:hypothetical protein
VSDLDPRAGPRDASDPGHASPDSSRLGSSRAHPVRRAADGLSGEASRDRFQQRLLSPGLERRRGGPPDRIRAMRSRARMWHRRRGAGLRCARQCTSELARSARADLATYPCPAGIGPALLDDCASRLRSESCHPISTLARMYACRPAAFCLPTRTVEYSSVDVYGY